jgi:hypothetical protein
MNVYFIILCSNLGYEYIFLLFYVQK